MTPSGRSCGGRCPAAGRAHRLASVRHTDNIYVLEHGKVIEQGIHATLPALSGLYTLQASAYQ